MDITNCWGKLMGKLKLKSSSIGWEFKSITLEKGWWLLIKLNIHLTYNSTIPLMQLLSIYSREKKSYVLIEKCIQIWWQFYFVIFPNWKQPQRLPAVSGCMNSGTSTHEMLALLLLFSCKWCPALLDLNCSPPGSSVHGILQARIPDWVSISFSKGSSLPGIEPTSPALAGGFFPTKPPGKTQVYIKYYWFKRQKQTPDTHIMMLDFKRIMLSERSQTQKATYRMMTFAQHSRKEKTLETEDGAVAASGQRWGEAMFTNRLEGIRGVIELLYFLVEMVAAWLHTLQYSEYTLKKGWIFQVQFICL